MPARDQGRGTLVLDRRTPVGRLRIASGTNDVRLFRQLNAMLTALQDSGRLDLLTTLRDRAVSPLEVYAAYRGNDLSRLPTGEALQPLAASVRAWVTTAECGAKSREAHNTFAGYVERHAAERARLSELPEVLRRIRAACREAGTHPTFNRLRSSAQAFVRDTQGKRTELYGAIADVPRLAATKARANNPQTPADLCVLVSLLDDPAHRAAVWGMALTGMGPSEWFQATNKDGKPNRWDVLGTGAPRVHVTGTKRDSRDRELPLVLPALWSPSYGAPRRAPEGEAPDWSILRFARALKEATEGRVQPYDLRRTFSNLCAKAGVLEVRKEAYMGHLAGASLARLYEAEEVARYLRRDAAALAGYVVGELREALALSGSAFAVTAADAPTVLAAQRPITNADTAPVLAAFALHAPTTTARARQADRAADYSPRRAHRAPTISPTTPPETGTGANPHKANGASELPL